MVEAIPLAFEKNGYYYELIREYGNIVIFKQLKAGKVYGYEVLKLRLVFHTGRDKKGYWVKDENRKKWRFPSNEEFGLYRWSFQELKNAETKFLTMTGGKG
jgi:hypothetical protein